MAIKREPTKLDSMKIRDVLSNLSEYFEFNGMSTLESLRIVSVYIASLAMMRGDEDGNKFMSIFIEELLRDYKYLKETTK